MSKRKWKVYTTDELRDRFQAKPGGVGGNNVVSDDQSKLVIPNLKRRNSAPPGMIHFPPGTFTSHSQNQQQAHAPSQSSPHSYVNTSPVPTPAHQHDLVTHSTQHTHINRGSPTSSNKASHHPYRGGESGGSGVGGSRLERRRASLPFIPSSSSSGLSHHSHTLGLGGGGVQGHPSIEAHLAYLQSRPLAPYHEEDEEESQPPLSPSQTLPSFQSFLQTISEDADEEDSEIREIEERANGSPIMQTSKTLPMNYKEMVHNKSPQQTRYQHEQNAYYSPTPSHNNFSFTNNKPQDPPSPSGKFYKNNISKSNENLPSLSRMSINDILS